MNLIDEKLAPAKSPKPTLSLPILARFVESSGFNNASLALIVFSAAILGFETDRDLYQSNRDYFVLLDRGILAFLPLRLGCAS